MFQSVRLMPCPSATAAATASGRKLPFGCGIADGLAAAPATPNGRSPRTGPAYSAAAQFRAPAPSFPSNATRGTKI